MADSVIDEPGFYASIDEDNLLIEMWSERLVLDREEFLQLVALAKSQGWL